MSEEHTPDIIYLEADSEITEAIDKFKAAKAHEVRVAVPARSTLLQSAVNIKLFKKAAENNKKKLVLISNDKATLSLAAGLGVLVAKNVKAEAAIPEALTGSMGEKAANEPIVIEQENPPEGSTSQKGKKAKQSNSFQKQHIALDGEDTKTEEAENSQHHPVASHPAKEKKVPNFGGLNKKIFWIVAGIGALVLLILGYIFLPTAKVALIAKAQKTPVNLKFTLDAGTKRSDFSSGDVAADTISTTKEVSGQFNASGKKDVGTKATGNITIKNAASSNAISLPAGTTVVSDGKGFTTNQAVSVPGASVSGGQIVPGTANVAITATQSGDSYNFGSAAFLVNGYSGLTATGSTSGGVSKTVTVVTQADIDKAQKALIEDATNNVKTELQNKAGDNEYVFEQTLTTEATSVSSSVPVDSEGSIVTLTAQIKFSELAAKNSDLDELFRTQIQSKVPGGNDIYQSGASDATYTLVKSYGADKADMAASSNAFYGQSIDKDQVAKSIAGKSKKDAADIIKPIYPQVTQVLVETNPWLSPNLPFFANRIKVDIRVQTD